MGQAQSDAGAAEELKGPTIETSPSTESSPGEASLDSLIAEAAAYGDNDTNQSLEAKAQKALECPCIAHLQTGPCGVQFTDAFVCFLKSSAEEKGSDCVNPFIALQKCIKANPDAFSKEVLDDKEEKEAKKEENSSPKSRIRPPLWSGSSGQSKL